jgi:hypothetical protein
MNTDSKKQKDAEFLRQHTLTPQDFKRMIAEKMERARAYSSVINRKNATLTENR